MSFLSSNHGQLRRHQRNIGKRQLQAALKHGTRTSSSKRGCSKYSYNGITFIVDDATKREVTSFATTLDLPWKNIAATEWQRHTWARQQMRTQAMTFCKSHSILLVDTSGSMRNSDVQGSRSRLGAVWHAIAEDYIKNRIDTGNAGEADAISVILMGETATFHPLLHFVPTDWVTYNAVLKIYKEGSITPRGHGCYRPALEMAESVLSQYDSSSCALMLAIMSDGRPSDSSVYRQSVEDGTKSITASIASLSSKLGKRLTVSAIGMGSANQFETLKKMTEEAENHESKGLFQVPSMSSSSIAAAISSIATSLTDTQTDITSQRFVRKMTRENRKMLPVFTEAVDPKDFRVYMGSAVDHKV
jgi:Mg-chelatase subunit ChlD